jgi:molybdopterin synthase sulfur carrier subunit
MKVLYFAWVKAEVGHGQEEVSPPTEVATVADLLAWLSGRGPGHAKALGSGRPIRVAVNQSYARPEDAVAPGDEIAIFPPVTGG